MPPGKTGGAGASGSAVIGDENKYGICNSFMGVTIMHKPLSRRTLLAALGVGLPLAGLSLSIPAASARDAAVTVMDPRAVYEKVKKGELLLVDVRTPQEWQQTGIPEGARTIELAPGFLAKLMEATGGDKSKPVAFICATGARSAYVARELAKRGWTNVIDVAGGVMGGPKGKGWIASGLPMQKLK